MKSIMLSVQSQWVEKTLGTNNVVSGEIWADLKDYENLYIISNYGRIISLPRNTTSGKLLTPQISKYGYYMQMLYKNGKHKLCRVNRLVASTFIENPNNELFINHIDGNKLNNKVDNLEWCNRSHNQKEAYRLGLQKVSDKQRKVASEFAKTKRIKISQYDLSGKFIKSFESMTDASNKLNIPVSCINRVCNGKRKQTHGSIFYKEVV
ncbi:MAG: NUMOD4 domain-containing protein [Christensenellales bacterium]